MPQEILPPENASPVPDDATLLGFPPDHTGSSSARGRVFHLNLGIFKYGTDDKAHAAAMGLSLLIFVFLGILLCFGQANANTDNMIAFLQNALLLTIGVAIGQGTSTDSKAP